MQDIRSLCHSKRRCKYHIVFPPKYRRQMPVSRGTARGIDVVVRRFHALLKELLQEIELYIVEKECCSNHISMSAEILLHLKVKAVL